MFAYFFPQVLSNSVAAAVRTLVGQGVLPNALSTAFFCEDVNKWFDCLNCQFADNALHVHTQEKITFLNEVNSFLVKKDSFKYVVRLIGNYDVVHSQLG